MKIKLIIVIAAIFSLLCVGCGEKEPANKTDIERTKGEWVLESWNGSEVLSEKVYLKLDAGKFTLYQSIDNLGFKLYSGQYTIADGVISGSYSDGVAWDQKYNIEGQETKKMVMVGQTTKSVAIYSNITIPAYVKDGALQPSRSESTGLRFL